jgi:cytochrome P450
VLEAALHPLVGGNRGLVSSDLSEWHSSRTTIRTVFSVTNVARFVPDIAQYSMQLRAALLHHATTSRRFPMIEPIEEWAADITFRFLIGKDTAVQQGGWGKEASTHVQTIITHADNHGSLNPWTNRQRKKARSRCRERVRGMIRMALNEALEKDQPAANNQFISLLHSLATKYREEYPERTQWDSDTLAQHVDTVMTLFLAADVSSMVLTVAFPLFFPLTSLLFLTLPHCVSIKCAPDKFSTD